MINMILYYSRVINICITYIHIIYIVYTHIYIGEFSSKFICLARYL